MSLQLPERKERNPPKDFVKDRRAVIDGDRYPYMIGFAAQKTIREVWLEGEFGSTTIASFETKKELDSWLETCGLSHSEITFHNRIEADPVANCLHSVKVALQSAIEGSKAETYQVYVGGKTNFRDDVAVTTPYKGTRNQAKPVHFDAIREYMISHWDAIEVDGIETDDQLAIEFTKDPENTVIVSDDKDLNTVPSWRYIPSKDVLFKVSEQDALLWNYSQTILGDSVDAIKGIPRKGKIAAYHILKDCETEEDMFWAVLDAYDDSGYERPYNTFVEMMQLTYMIRELNEDGSPKMWEVPC